MYSWVPPDVQDAILRVCSRNLAPNGIAYVSYNTYPGWHVRMMAREMLVEHDDPRAGGAPGEVGAYPVEHQRRRVLQCPAAQDDRHRECRAGDPLQTSADKKSMSS